MSRGINRTSFLELLLPGRAIHSIWISTSPCSTFLSLRDMSWTSLPLFQIMQLSPPRQFSLFGWTLSTTVPVGRFCNSIFMHSRYGLMSISTSPILSSTVNVSLSYTLCKNQKEKVTHKTHCAINHLPNYGNNVLGWAKKIPKICHAWVV